MMTKTQFANKIIDDFCRDEGLNRSKVTNWGIHVFKSSRLAVALEFLNMINEDDKIYSKSRGGIEYICAYDRDNNGYVPILSTRELLDLLPDTV